MKTWPILVLLPLVACPRSPSGDSGDTEDSLPDDTSSGDSAHTGETGDSATSGRATGSFSLVAGDYRVEGLAADGRLGSAVAVGDLDGDGLAEWAVGAPTTGPGGTVFLFAGGRSGPFVDADADAIVHGAVGGGFGTGLVILDDLDGDGLREFLVGAPLDNDSTGRVYGWSGPPPSGGETSARMSLLGEAPDDEFGVEIGAVGDHDGDGVSEVGVGAWMADPVGEDAGALYLFGYEAGSRRAADASAILVGDQAFGWAGYSFAGGGDLDGDGWDDLVVGADGVDGPAGHEGTAYVVRGPVSGEYRLLDADAVILGNRPNAYAGHAVAMLPDGQAAVGAFADGGDESGTVALYDGVPTSGRMNEAAVVVTPGGEGDLFGYALASAGDVDGDGAFDLAASGPTRGTGAGQVWVLYGAIDGGAPQDSTHALLLGEEGDAAGYVLAAGGDVDGDGSPDVIVGARTHGDDDVGAAYVWTAR